MPFRVSTGSTGCVLLKLCTKMSLYCWCQKCCTKLYLSIGQIMLKMHFFQKLFKIVFRIPLLTYKWSHSINYKLILNYKCFKQDIYCSFATL